MTRIQYHIHKITSQSQVRFWNQAGSCGQDQFSVPFQAHRRCGLGQATKSCIVDIFAGVLDITAEQSIGSNVGNV